MKGGVNYLIDVDIKGYFDHVDHKWLMRMMKERIVDRTILRLIGKWLKAGVIEEGKKIRNEVGVPQGGVNLRFWPISTCTTFLICVS